MIKVYTFLFFLLILNGCDQVLEPVKLGQVSSTELMAETNQDNFKIVQKTLTLSNAKKAKKAPYDRKLHVPGNGNLANIYDEIDFIKSTLPPNNEPTDYLLGVGDELTFVQMFEPNGTESNNIEQDKLILNTAGIVGTDGTVLLLRVGAINAAGRPLKNIREEVRNILIRKGLSPNFQLEITKFSSQIATLFSPQGNKKFTITDKPTSLKLLLAGVIYKKSPQTLSLITLKRGGKVYKLTNQDLLREDRQQIFIQNNDQIEIEEYSYKKGSVYTLTASNNAKIISIDPINRETMADMLFQQNGPLSNIVAKRSEIYLLRGTKPIVAYHLNAQNVSSILVASHMELRPDDIIYVAQRPIISFSRLLSEISILRVLLRDIRNNNIP